MVELTGLSGTNPLGYLAALGVLDVAQRVAPDRRAALAFTSGFLPHAVIEGFENGDQVVDLALQDIAAWRDSPVLCWGPGEATMDDLRPDPVGLRDWAVAVYDVTQKGRRRDADLWCALVAEGAVAGKGNTKPTHLDFTAGQQRFLQMARKLVDGVTRDDLDEAILGLWKYQSDLPSFRWDVRGERIYAVSAHNPSSDPPKGVPGANWLALLGLRFFPVAVDQAKLLTTGCEVGWKVSSLTWPLWTAPLSADSVGSLMRIEGLRDLSPQERRCRGISGVCQAPIRRTDQGGYGSFGGPTVVLDA